MRIFLSAFYVIIFQQLALGSRRLSDYKLEQLQVLFRHGDRAVIEAEVYETDPYDKIHQSYGYGQLTKIGKQREYKIGQLLRKLYGNFLGDYKNNDVHAYSSDVDRTKMSLQLVLAGLYPPSSKSTWNKMIDWQPIPTHYDSIYSNFLTAGHYCPKFQKQYERIASTPEILLLFHKYQGFFERLQNSTGITFSTLFTAVPLYNNLHAALSLGLPLPAWCSWKDYNELKKIAAVGFKALSYTEQMRRTIVGPIVEQFLKAIDDESKKIYLYSGHDINVQVFVDSHNISGAPALHDFGSTIIFEKLRGPDDRIYVRMYMWTGVSEQLIPLKLENCGRICPLTEYAKIVKTILPNSLARQCLSLDNLCRRRSDSVAEIEMDYRLSYLFAGSDLTSFKYMKNFSLSIEEL